MSPDISQHIVDILRTITTDGLPVGKEQAYNLGQILQKNKVHFSVAIGGIYHFRKVSHPFLLREYESLEGYLAGLQHMEDIYHIMLLAISEGYQESQT
ncbi:MAG: hypothetical protein B6242_00185 [Anaerolineaceae bacterium 4572_78]|nr:MAG: hypothetical protein B6242_00185 [Anaerolineaceae bacterium 4572_78]